MRVIETSETATDISRHITRAKLTKQGIVEVDFDQVITIEKDGKPIELSGGSSYKGRNIAHQDLIDAFALFNPHFAIICELPEAKGVTLHELENDLETIAKIKVRSFSIGGSGDSEGMTLSGFKELRGGKVLNFNTPFIKFIDEIDPYDYAIELQHVKNHVIEQVDAYLDGKVAPNAQLDMFEDDPDEAYQPED